jgi:DNA-binding NtrC family response regulator
MNILIVDDDKSLVRSLEIVLRVRGHCVTSFCDPAAAKRHLEREPEVDVLLLDYVMGGMNGDALLESVGRNLSPGCRTIMITGHREQIQSTTSLRAMGVSRLLSKPLDLDQLCTLVEGNREETPRK